MDTKQLRKLLRKFGNKCWDAGWKYGELGGRANRMSGKGELRFSNRYQNVSKIIEEVENRRPKPVDWGAMSKPDNVEANNG